MYGLITYIWVVLGVNVGKYTIHWASGMMNLQRSADNFPPLEVQTLDESPPIFTECLGCSKAFGGTERRYETDHPVTRPTGLGWNGAMAQQKLSNVLMISPYMENLGIYMYVYT